jgi:hypothetical protein
MASIPQLTFFSYLFPSFHHASISFVSTRAFPFQRPPDDRSASSAGSTSTMSYNNFSSNYDPYGKF